MTFLTSSLKITEKIEGEMGNYMCSHELSFDDENVDVEGKVHVHNVEEGAVQSNNPMLIQRLKLI